MPLPTIPSGNVASATASTSFQIANSIMLAGDSYFSRTCSNAYYDEVTFNFWVKRAVLGTDQGLFGRKGTNATAHGTFCHFTTDDALLINFRDSGGTSQYYIITTRKFRDVSAWYNIHIRVDGLDGTQNDRIQLWVNGVRETAFDLFNSPSSTGYQIATFLTNGSQDFTVGRSLRSQVDTFYNLEGYIAEFHCCTGQHYACTEFGEFDSDSPRIWKPKETSGISYGNDGFYLDFEDSGDLDDDESGEGHDFTGTNIAATDQSIDTPTINYPILNSVVQNFGSNNDRFLEGALKYYNVDENWESAFSTFGFTKGKWYWEVKIITLASSNGYANLGVQDYDLLGSSGNTNANFIANSASAGMELDYRGGTNNNIMSATSNLQDAGVDWAADDIVGFAADMDNNKLYMHKNGTYLTIGGSVGDPTSGSTGTGACAIPSTFTTCTPAIGIYGANAIFHFNFGSANYTISSGNSDANSQGSFEHSVPSGYFALNSKNLAEFG
jgi:hypothetical protein